MSIWLLGILTGVLIGSGAQLAWQLIATQRAKHAGHEQDRARHRWRYEEVLSHTGHELLATQERLRRQYHPEEVTRVAIHCGDCDVLVSGLAFANPDRLWEEDA